MPTIYKVKITKVDVDNSDPLYPDAVRSLHWTVKATSELGTEVEAYGKESIYDISAEYYDVNTITKTQAMNWLKNRVQALTGNTLKVDVKNALDERIARIESTIYTSTLPTDFDVEEDL